METQGEISTSLRASAYTQTKGTTNHQGQTAPRAVPGGIAALFCVNPHLELSDPTHVMAALRKGPRKLLVSLLARLSKTRETPADMN